jgi:hypothetical protein
MRRAVRWTFCTACGLLISMLLLQAAFMWAQFGPRTIDRLIGLRTGMTRADVLLAMEPFDPEPGPVWEDRRRCTNEMTYRDVPRYGGLRWFEAKTRVGGLWVHLCFDEANHYKGAPGFTMVEY